jgi:hypothetical protein
MSRRVGLGGGLTSRLGTTELHGEDELIVLLCFERVGFLEQGVGPDGSFVFWGVHSSVGNICKQVLSGIEYSRCCVNNTKIFVATKIPFPTLKRSLLIAKPLRADERRIAVSLYLHVSSNLRPYMDMGSCTCR